MDGAQLEPLPLSELTAKQRRRLAAAAAAAIRKSDEETKKKQDALVKINVENLKEAIFALELGVLLGGWQVYRPLVEQAQGQKSENLSVR